MNKIKTQKMLIMATRLMSTNPVHKFISEKMLQDKIKISNSRIKINNLYLYKRIVIPSIKLNKVYKILIIITEITTYKTQTIIIIIHNQELVIIKVYLIFILLPKVNSLKILY